MIIFLAIIGIISIMQFIPKFIAVCMIRHLNKLHMKEIKKGEYDPIYYLSSDKCLWWHPRDGFYFLPSISSTVNTKEVAFEIRWLGFAYVIAYYYKHASD